MLPGSHDVEALTDQRARPSVKGTVHLVGAGPGDPGLITRRGIELVRAAEVLVYDSLAAPEIVREAPPDCELVDAGKRAGDHTLTQDETNDLIVSRALAGKMVVRLKGGDPFLFGRGGEEAEACHRHRVPVDVVPGVTSAFAAPAYAGIPATHRGVADNVTVVTASTGPTGDGDPDYAWLARSTGTLIFLMGLRRVEHICKQLAKHGMPRSRPAAAVSRGTTRRQRTIVGTVSTLARKVRDAELAAPAIIVIGDVVGQREAIDWFERRPLYGRTITVTRARAQASELVTILEELGATVVEMPVITIERLPPAQLDAEIDELGSRDYLLFTSRNGAAAFFDRVAERGLDARVLGGVRVGVVGAQTADVCRANGIVPDIVPPPDRQTGAGLLEALGNEPLYGSSVVMVRGEEGRPELPEGIVACGARLTIVPAYRNVARIPETDTVLAALHSDAVTFTAASTVRNFMAYVPEGAPRPPAVTIGPVTTEAATAAGFQIVGEARQPGVHGIAVALLEYFDRQEATA